ncbi:peptidylprolyl isomerase [Maritimibacter dapengensis]|uniref:peptidylprolyl isomerase n=1 Tax=Maritimibacter dapengensis TaxID=2836868 RepID=A0ABS6T4G3_9RHOB|nr:peptidylprolyl isomerase [Maritimibacter dapengensis]MBV7380134.1 peptidylprolyl isomerase [Maritimibacter dapengensis]
MTYTPTRASLVKATLLSVSLALPGWAQEEETVTEEPTSPSVTAETVVATVNGEDITVAHVAAARATLPQQYQQLPNEVLLPGLVDQLVQQTVLSQAIDQISPMIEIQLDNERRQMVAAQKIESVVSDGVDEAAIQAAYDAKYEGAEPTTEWNASHILVETEAEAADLVEQAREEDADFAALAKEHSTGPSGPSGGELGWFSTGMMVEPFETAVADMEAGDVQGPIQTEFGWHVIKLNETREKGAPALEEVRQEIVAELQTSAVEEAVAKLLEDADVERMDIETLDPAILTDPSMFQ